MSSLGQRIADNQRADLAASPRPTALASAILPGGGRWSIVEGASAAGAMKLDAPHHSERSRKNFYVNDWMQLEK